MKTRMQNKLGPAAASVLQASTQIKTTRTRRTKRARKRIMREVVKRRRVPRVHEGEPWLHNLRRWQASQIEEGDVLYEIDEEAGETRGRGVSEELEDPEMSEVYYTEEEVSVSTDVTDSQGGIDDEEEDADEGLDDGQLRGEKDQKRDDDDDEMGGSFFAGPLVLRHFAAC
ncbi:uncharacterized protein LY89DRAFT_680116 [Mollisia scopiformis]|uniref:Uncharacterized protein n=1 Tax=Mollisia scopiformis TaxID=149040 RepID=A0A194XT84_MOLSC|nr:uncharacterized protein LY89DRAFT_680116 [Mollisia scopiformis]KUJ23356.1 hypothetical protein LY89DRAFT_680116 [Mollisia scopiformis]